MNAEPHGRNAARWKPMRSMLRMCGLPLLLLAMASAGCRQVEPVAADIDPLGVFALVSIDGKAVPCDLAHGGMSVPVRGGVFTIRADGTCISEMSLTAPGGRDVVVTRSATFTRQGPTLTMKWEGFGVNGIGIRTR